MIPPDFSFDNLRDGGEEQRRKTHIIVELLSVISYRIIRGTLAAQNITSGGGPFGDTEGGRQKDIGSRSNDFGTEYPFC
jgi:hypothetical protein